MDEKIGFLCYDANMNYSVVMVAAGKGTRTGLEYNKVFFSFEGKSVIEHSLTPFMNDPECIKIILVISIAEQSLFQERVDSPKVVFVQGGDTRQESVYAGLKEVQSDIVMIHDGARPYITRDQVSLLKETMRSEDACLLMVPVVDTIKQVKDGYVVHTPNRSEYYAAQTPQCFNTELLKKCYEQALIDAVQASDDAQLVECFSDVRIKVVMGSYSNKKITTKEDVC